MDDYYYNQYIDIQKKYIILQFELKSEREFNQRIIKDRQNHYDFLLETKDKQIHFLTQQIEFLTQLNTQHNSQIKDIIKQIKELKHMNYQYMP